MNPSSKDIAEIMEVSTLALTPGTDLFRFRMPPTPQDCVVVLDISGNEPMVQLSKDRSDYYYSAVSIQVRNIDYLTGYGIALDIFQFLHGTAHIIINDTYYSLIKAMADPQLLHYDGNDRAVFVINFEVQRRTNL